MEWHHFEYFKQLAQTENMSECAKMLNVSQSTLSRAIKNLEAELGIPLFNRVGRTIKLNKYGVEFLKTTNNIVNEMDIYKSNIIDSTNIYNGKLIIGFLHSVGVTYISEFLKSFNLKYPNIQLKLVQNDAKHLIEMLDDGEVDIIITTISEKSKNTHFEPLIVEKLYVTLHENHQLGQRSEIAIEELMNEKFILLKPNLLLRQQVDEILKVYQFTPEISFEGDEVITIATFISSGLGVSILPHLRDIRLPNLKQIPIKNHDAKRTIGLCYKNKSNKVPIINRTKESLIAYFKNI
ncbi:LysR family transcriptional regulator [Staphylococcus edaphicus]|uniref:LysR family transcriptional regulator n=1 Tax=Staphylococcus edaphicus TaxID=1955013 RepID=A0A2C6WPL5_9STAP|nr:LysR family transcriptional regulator [Staphylococcus edaphicus]PHK50015.1 LysR family transcriptional regulator [Staphylococcus edaphicus]UQW81724.1 LysR family transcriptional regulator [Staphylococcus edaphicus]